MAGLQKKKIAEACIYCGNEGNTRDHVPPKLLFPKPRGPMVTVPACLTCNKCIEKDDVLFAVASCLEADLKHPAATHVWESTYVHSHAKPSNPTHRPRTQLHHCFVISTLPVSVVFKRPPLRTAAQIHLPTLVVQSNVPGLHHTPARSEASTVRQFPPPPPIPQDSCCAQGR